jgi:methyl-accepting chemotaxis protein
MLLAVLVVVILIAGANQSKVIGKLIEEESSQICQARATQLGVLIDKLNLQLLTFASSESLLSSKRADVGSFIQGLTPYLAGELAGLFFAWPDGQCITSYGATGDVSDRDYFKAIISDESNYAVGSPDMSKTISLPVVVLAQGINDRNGKRLGILALEVKLDALSDVAASIKVGATGFGWIVDQRGLTIAHKDLAKVMAFNMIDSAKDGYKGMAELGMKMLDAESGSGAWRSPEGTEYRTYFAAVPNTPGWRLGISQPTAEISAPIVGLQRILAFICLVGILLTLPVSFQLARSIAKPIKSAGAFFRILAEGEADLTQKIELDRNDEIGDLVSDFNIFLDKLRSIVLSLKGSQSGLSVIGGELSQSVDGASGAMRRMSSDMGAVRESGQNQAASVEESSSAVSQIARNIASLDDLIVNQASTITEASAAIEEMVGNIRSVSSYVERMASEFKELSSASEEGKSTMAQVAERIAQISAQSKSLLDANEVIAGIASNTNLLAMNAAIEAAHAGDAGKGFSVVADEIRRLSETSGEQSKAIGKDLSLILEAINDVVAVSKSSEDAFSIVAQKISATDAVVHQVSQAMTEQGEGSRQVLEALGDMNDITTQVRGASSEMSAGNTAVLEEMARLRDAAFEVKSRLDAMAESAASIQASMGTVERMAGDTSSTIDSLEAVIGRFKA